jgi:TATA-box binding protein (TBP) (component of TFIID and TFIIIB)
MVKFKAVRLCKEDAMSMVPTEILRYNLEKATQLLIEAGYEAESRGLMVLAKGEGHEFTLYASGRMLISHVESKEKATEVANRVYEIVEDSSEPSPIRRF